MLSFSPRIDCISRVTPTGKPRDGQSVYEKLNLREYVRSGFQTQGNSRRHVSIRRFGTKEAQYTSAEALHFIADADVEINDTFFNWILGFGKDAKILKPEWAAEAFLKHVDKIKNIYEENQ